MERKIVKSLREWLPWFVEGKELTSEYTLLNSLADFCAQHISEGEEKKAKQVIDIINLLYMSGSLHDKNAIENEFLEVLAQSDAPASLKAHMKLFPERLKQAYLKTILEN